MSEHTENDDQGAQVGRMAPEFTLPNQDGKPVSLSDYRGRNVVVYFYPKDDTPGCTAEACSFRDSYEVFTDAGAEVIGISSDSSASHKQFASQYHLPFVLLSDEGGAVRKRYKVPASLGLIPGRVTYVIDAQGVVRHIFSSQINVERHVAESVRILKELQTAQA